jgi:hypothetical protein
MLDAVFNLLKAMLGFGFVIGLWLGLQEFVRWRSGCARDKDVLDYMPHNCAGCNGSGCHKKAGEEHHELV